MKTIKEKIWEVIKSNTEEKAFGCVECDKDETHLIISDMTLFLVEMERMIEDEISPLQHYKDTSQGLFVTDIAPEHLFHKLMNFRSDANPFTEDGECQVEDGYAYIANMWDEFYKTVFFQLEGEPRERQLIVLMDDMCAHSLDPETGNKWDEVRDVLFKNRKALKVK